MLKEPSGEQIASIIAMFVFIAALIQIAYRAGIWRERNK